MIGRAFRPAVRRIHTSTSPSTDATPAAAAAESHVGVSWRGRSPRRNGRAAVPVGRARLARASARLDRASGCDRLTGGVAFGAPCVPIRRVRTCAAGVRAAAAVAGVAARRACRTDGVDFAALERGSSAACARGAAATRIAGAAGCCRLGETAAVAAGAGASTGGIAAGGGVGDGVGSAGGGDGGGAGGTTTGRDGRNRSGSRYPCGSADRLTPMCTYGCASSGVPLGPTLPTVAPSRIPSPRRIENDPRWVSVTE